MTLDPMRSTTPTTEEDRLRSGLSGKTNFSQPYISILEAKNPYQLPAYQVIMNHHHLPTKIALINLIQIIIDKNKNKNKKNFDELT